MRLHVLTMMAVVGTACTDGSADPKSPGDDAGTQVDDLDSGEPDDSGGDDSGGDDSGDDGGGDSGGGDGLSEVNSYSETGCALLDATPESLAIGATESEANTAVLIPDGTTAWMLQMPESGDGWFVVEVPDWMSYMHIFTEEGVEVEVLGGEVFTEPLRNGACPDAGISDQLMAFHEWGAYTFRIPEGAPAEVWFTVVKVD